VIVLDMQKVINVDYTGLDLLESLQRKLERSSKRLIFAGLNPQPATIFLRSGFAAKIGRENLAPDLAAALERA
jgi:SulP family sulfate permease